MDARFGESAFYKKHPLSSIESGAYRNLNPAELQDLLTEFIQSGTYENLAPEDFKALLDYLAEAYHSGLAIVDDMTFDTLQDYYEQRIQPYTQVGAPPRGEKVKLPYYLGSLNKVKTEPELTRWISDHPGPYVLQDKMDGITLLYVSMLENGKRIYKLYTRGGGTEGKDVSHAIPYLNLPAVKYDLAVRGEAIIFKEAFEQIGVGFAKAQNMVTGIFGRKESFDPEVVQYIRFFAFRIVAAGLDPITTTPEIQILQLREIGFETPWAVGADELTVEQLENIYQERRKEAPYDIDGIVIYQNQVIEYPIGEDPKQAIAFKMPGETTQTKVINVEWQASKDRRLVPVVYYNPVTLSGAVLTKASGDNARYIIEHNIGPGAKIEIIRSGEVIPRVVRVIVPAENPAMPDRDFHGPYYYDGVDFILYQDTPQVKAAKMGYFIRQLDIANLGPGRIATLIQNGIYSIKQLLNATPEQFETLPGIGPKLATQIYFDLHQKIEDVPLPTIMAASGVFSGFGKKRLRQIVEAIPNILQFANNPDLPVKIQQLGGFQELAYQFAEKLPEFINWLNEHPMINVLLPEPPVSNTLQGVTVVFSGFRDQNLEDEIRKRGGRVTTSVSRNTSVLVVKDLHEQTSKPQKARQMNIPIVTKDDFMQNWL
jgi:NAD-dependent DNA ligase